jgi:hypothetical protein
LLPVAHQFVRSEGNFQVTIYCISISQRWLLIIPRNENKKKTTTSEQIVISV